MQMTLTILNKITITGSDPPQASQMSLFVSANAEIKTLQTLVTTELQTKHFLLQLYQSVLMNLRIIEQ